MRDVNDLPHVDLRDPDRTARIVAGLTTHGVTVFHGCTGRDEVLRVARSLVTIRTHRDSDRDGVTAIAPRQTPGEGPSLAGFTDRELRPHTEGSAVNPPPGVLMLACIRPAQTGGHSHLVDGRELYDEIARTDPVLLAALSQPRSAYFGGGSGHLGAVFRETVQGRVAVRIRFDALARFSPALTPHIGRLRELAEHRAITVDLREGDGYILLNDRWLHGRTRFTGQRLMLRVIGDPLPQHNLPDGFQPTARPPNPDRCPPTCRQSPTAAGPGGYSTEPMPLKGTK